MPRPGWREALLNRRMLICVFTGFSSGLPLYLLLNLVPAWLRTEGIGLKAIGLFALIQIALHLEIPLVAVARPLCAARLGRRRGWMAADARCCCSALIAALGVFSPTIDLQTIVIAGRAAGLRLGDAGHRARRLPPRTAARSRAGPRQLGARQRLPHRRTGARLAVADPGRPPALGAGVRHHRAVHAARAWR